ncbi:hypothetical protein ACI6Q5_05360 [Xanthomonas codiaei]|uniref:Uncharacterized protein n=1 Tax=Xanthomonas codiaei TaxID=56463 RepID=A0ABW9MJB4_9XANT
MSAPVPPKKRSGCGTLILVVVVGLFLLMLVGRCSSPSDTAKSASSSANNKSATTSTAAATPPLSAAELLAKAQDKALATSVRIENIALLKSAHPTSPEAGTATLLQTDLEKQLHAEQNPVGLQWRYRMNTDEMSGNATRSASVDSTNSFEFDFPYTGRQHATLQLRRHPRWGSDVILSIERGQILCSSYSECPVRVRFDDSPAKVYHGTEPADNSSDTVFIPGYDGFVKKLSTAKRVRIEVNVYQQGAVMAEFDVTGFDSSKLKSSR